MSRISLRRARRSGFSLIELLVVVIILAILVAIVVPSLISSQPERNLAAASEKFGLDIKYAMNQAENSGNMVYIGFDFDLNEDNIEHSRSTDGVLVSDVQPGGRFVPPGNPGAARTAKRYFIVEARKRWRDEVLAGLSGGTASFRRSDEPKYLIPYTYLDWLNLDDSFQSGEAPSAPIEPLFPYASGIGEPRDGDFNATATPRYVYPMQMRSGSNDYTSRFIGNTPDWSLGGRADQVHKMFCVADREEILAYDQAPIRRDNLGLRLAGPEDSPLLSEQIVDYVLLKEVELPEHVVFMNPAKNYWLTNWEDTTGGVVEEWQDMQFLQHLWAFTPDGEVRMADWSYDSFGAPDVYVHGSIAEQNDTPQPYCAWLTIEEVAEDLFDGDVLNGSPFDERKPQQEMNGRMFVLWPLNGQYAVLDYAPNDSGRGSLEEKLANNEQPIPSLDNDDVVAKRELAYSQRFLAGP